MFLEIIARVASKEKPPYRPNFAADDCPASIHTLTAMCWTDDPDDRPEFPAILKVIRKQTGYAKYIENMFLETLGINDAQRKLNLKSDLTHSQKFTLWF